MSEETIAQPTSISDLQRKMSLSGVVTRTELYGAFVDLGLEHEGLIHISRMARRRVKKVTDKVNVGDEVNVWVLDVDPEAGRIGLTMVQPPEVDWDELEIGEIRTGRVVRLERYGAFVDVGAERPGLLHVREMGNSYVRHPSEIVREGETIEVRIQGVNRRKRQIDLTMDLGNEPDTVEEDLEPLLSPMEVAYRRARNRSNKRRERKHRDKERQHRRYEDEFDKIYRRTLDKD